MSMIDCGPDRLAIWKELHAESALAVAEELEKVMLERGPVMEVNYHLHYWTMALFRSEIFQTMLKKMEDKKLLQGKI